MHPQKLAAVTKKKQVIDALMENDPVDLESVKYHYTEYLEKVEVLFAACQSEEDKTWLESHQTDIESFRSKIQSFIDNKTLTKATSLAGSRCSNKSVKSGASSTASARVEIARNKAKLEAEKASMKKLFEIKQRELELKRQYEDCQLQLEQEKLLAEHNRSVHENDILDGTVG